MPNRIIREGINSSAKVNRLSTEAENMYRRLLLVADDYGRYYANPATVRGGCWPTHPSPPCEQIVSNLLAECQQPASNLLTTYEVDGCRYLQIIGFNQKVRSKSKFPDPVSKLSTDCQQVADKMPALGVCEGVCEGVVRSAEAKPTARIVPMPQPVDYGIRYRALYDKHIVPGFMQDGEYEYAKVLQDATLPASTVADALDASHKEWMVFFHEHTSEYRPGIGKWLKEGYWTRRPKAREPTAEKLSVAQRAKLEYQQQMEKESRA